MNPLIAKAKLAKVKAFVFDIYCTLAFADKTLSGYQALPGAVELLRLLNQRGIPFAAFTNGSTKTPKVLNQALAQIGIDVEENKTLTPVSIAASIFQRKRYRRILVLGGEGVWSPLVDAGFEVVRSPERADDADAVLIGWHPTFSLPDLEAATRAVWSGAALYTVSKAPFVASREGKTIGISGAIAAAIKSVTGKNAVIVGKPSSQALSIACARLNVEPLDLAIVGDDPGLENAMAIRGGAMSIAVHTGLASAADFSNLPNGHRPHLSLSGIDRLLELLK
jgi:4-nitrophenyl phosphatase